MTILQPLIDRLAAWRFGEAPPLTASAVARHFRRQGWEVVRKHDREIALFVRDEALGLFGICLVPSGPSQSLLVRLPQLAARHHVTMLVLCGGGAGGAGRRPVVYPPGGGKGGERCVGAVHG